MTDSHTVETIRPYGPGKFNTMLDAYVYAVSMDGGCDDEHTNDDLSGHWYGMMKDGSTIFRDHDPFLETLKRRTTSTGVVLFEDSIGEQHHDPKTSSRDNRWIFQ